MSTTPQTGGFTPVRTKMVEDKYKFYQDTSFVTGDSPVVLDFTTDVRAYGAEEILVINDGTGSITVAIDYLESSGYGDEITVKGGETLEIEALRIRKLRITWVADTAYRVYAQ